MRDRRSAVAASAWGLERYCASSASDIGPPCNARLRTLSFDNFEK
jgi:hypothetical protein